MRLHNKIVVITGGATGSKTKLMGFGGTTAHIFAKEGAKVIITDINEDLGIQTVKKMVEMHLLCTWMLQMNRDGLI